MKRRMTIVLLMLMTVVVSVVAHDVKTISCSHLVRDYQGSIMSQVDSTGFWHNDWSYDAWGRPCNPQTHVVYNPSALTTYSSVYRGYCGHEHLPQFGLINMKVSDKPDEQSEARFDFAMARKLRVNLNARIYDPALSRFLSPDPYVQLPDNTQSFNRYSYCLNNPLKYIDEDGEDPVLFIVGVSALLGGTINFGTQWYKGNVNNIWEGLAAIGIGACAGASSAIVGIYSMAAFTSLGIAGGAISSFVGASLGELTNTAVLDAGNSFFLGDRPMSSFDYIKNSFMAGVTAGVISGFSAVSEGLNFWWGNPIATGRSPYSINNTPKYVDHTEEVSEKVRQLVEEMKPYMKFHDPKPTQELNISLESGDYKLNLRIETHSGVDRAFPDYHLTPQDEIRHMNIQFYKMRIEGKYQEIKVPSTQTKNYHKFLNFKY